MTDFKAIASSLEERGFCVVPEFLSREEIDFLEVEDVMETPEVGPGDLVLTRPQRITRDAGDRGSAHCCFVMHLRSGNADRLASGGRQSHAFYDGATRAPEPVEFPGFSTHPGKPLRHHSGGHRADPDWRARVA